MTDKILTPVKAIRAKCLDCMCDQREEIKLCPITNCSLYPYRLGKNPARKRTNEQKPYLAEKTADN